MSTVLHHPMKDERASCLGKTPYESRAAAERVKAFRGARKQWPMHAYRCEHCHKWHLGRGK